MIRKAKLADGPAIQRLINDFAAQGKMLARPLAQIYENIRDYFVGVERGRIVAVAGLHFNWGDLGEIKSVAVSQAHQRHGLGRDLVDACIQEGLALGVRRFYALTYVPDFFKQLGFKRIKREILPHKVWNECIQCPKFPDCDEIAVMLEIKKVSA